MARAPASQPAKLAARAELAEPHQLPLRFFSSHRDGTPGDRPPDARFLQSIDDAESLAAKVQERLMREGGA
jgi:hypothetical protein